MARWADDLGVLNYQAQVRTHVHGYDVVDGLGRGQPASRQARLAQIVVQVASLVGYLRPRCVVAALGGRSSALGTFPRLALVRGTESPTCGLWATRE